MDRIKKFDESYVLLDEMYSDPYFPDFLVEGVESEIRKLIDYLETGENEVEQVQKKLDEMTRSINNMEDSFYDNNSEIETLARESIAGSVVHILSWFDIKIDIEDALRFRTW